MDWKPASIEEVGSIINRDLADCDAKQREVFERYKVAPYPAPIVRYGEMESAVVVARKGNEVIYWEDVEEGFNISLVTPDGRICEHWCNQDDLGLALNTWISGRERTTRLGPRVRVE
jgi:hypothetical protein